MVSKFTQPDMTSMSPTVLKAAIDAAIAVLARIGAGAAPRAADTPDMTVTVDPAALFNRATGSLIPVNSQVTPAISAPASNTWIVRVYLDEGGTVGVVYGAASASPVAPSYPAGAFPVCQVPVSSTTTAITNAMIVDERAWMTGYGTPRNTFLITTSSTFVCPVAGKFLRLTMAGAGGGGGPGASAAADATKYGGGGGGGAACVVSRLFNAENLAITVGAGGIGGKSAMAAGGVTGQVAATDGGSTTVTGVTSVLTITSAGGVKGGAATAAANGAAGAGGAAGTGIAGTAGAAGTTTKGGDGGGVGTGGALSDGGDGGAWATTGRSGFPGRRGSGGGGASGYSPTGTDYGGNGGDGFVLVEVF